MTKAEARVSRRLRVAELYNAGGTQQKIADELGVNIGTVFNDLAILERDELVKKRPRGEAIAIGVSRYWQSDEGRQEAERRSEALRSEPPLQRVCEWCDESFELSPADARQQPGRFCSRECHHEWRRRGPESTEILERLRAGRRRWRAEVATLKAETGLVNLDSVLSALPRDLRRTRAAALGHVAAGGLVPSENKLGLLLFSDAAVADYVAWLRSHPDGRLRRFNATGPEQASFRGEWHRARHKSEAEFGRQNIVLAAANGKKPGPQRQSAPDEQAEVLRLRAEGLSIRRIAERVFGGESEASGRGKVARLLKAVT